MRGYKPGRFSFNVKGGRCEACAGDGIIKVEMHFLPDVYVPCEVCKGKRYNRETLDVRYKDKNISDVLDMTVDEALEFFRNIPPIQRKLEAAARRRPGLHQARPAGPDPVRRRSPAHQARARAVQDRHRPARSTCSTSRPPACTSRTCGMLLGVLNRLVEREQHRGRHRAQPGSHQVRGLDHRPRPEGGDDGGTIIAEGPPEAIVKVPAKLHRQIPQGRAYKSGDMTRNPKPKTRNPKSTVWDRVP